MSWLLCLQLYVNEHILPFVRAFSTGAEHKKDASLKYGKKSEIIVNGLYNKKSGRLQLQIFPMR